MQNNEQTSLRVDNKITDRTYINYAYTNRKGEKGVCLVFQRPFHERPFKDQAPSEMLTIKQYEEKYGVKITW